MIFEVKHADHRKVAAGIRLDRVAVSSPSSGCESAASNCVAEQHSKHVLGELPLKDVTELEGSTTPDHVKRIFVAGSITGLHQIVRGIAHFAGTRASCIVVLTNGASSFLVQRVCHDNV